MSDLTAQFVDDRQRQRLLRRFGTGAAGWLAGLPALVESLAEQWKLTVEGPAPHGRTSVVLHCRRLDGSPAIMKISPDAGLGVSEARVLRLWADTRRVPEVWAVDEERGALLLEAIGDGSTVAMCGTVPPMAEIGALIADLHSVPMSRRERMELNPLVSRVGFLFDMWERRRSEGPAAELVPASLLHHGHAWARALANGSDGDDAVPLHGDLHPGNVLDGGPERGLVAVDPRACLGDPAADGVDWVMWRTQSADAARRRAGELAPAMGVAEKRLLEWCSAFAPLFAVAFADRGRGDTPEFRMMIEAASSGL
ncbi:aminoglycoside phosphotransferase family protein [Nocardiopsis potens]|uniref:aminoglycoside phosphotransferase family protein n=1 Tax=Nocardiopsis potens TaxID=1246458 RepID=UPI000344D461|nr:aminoglycoside phosphotransferase family protein [Nocardiopsis potens]